MSKKKDRTIILEIETKKLMDFLYENELDSSFQQFSTYHFRILDRLDVWPGSKKYWLIGTKSSNFYEHVDYLLKVLFPNIKDIEKESDELDDEFNNRINYE